MKEIVRKTLDEEANEFEICEYENGELNGKRELWKGDQLIVRASYIKNKLNGSFESWYDSGQKHIQCFYLDNELHESYFSWWENGNPKESGQYTYGKRMSGYEWYDQNGNLINSSPD